MLLLHPNPFVNIAYNCQYEAQGNEFLWSKQNCLLIPTDPAILCPLLVGMQWQLAIPGWTKTFPPWHVLFTGLCWTEAKFIYSYFKDRFKIISRALTIFAFLRRHSMISTIGQLKGLSLQHLYKAGQTFLIIKHTLLPPRSLSKTTQNQCTFSPFPLA